MRKIIVIIPVYNAEKNLVKVISNLKLQLPSIDYVIIDDNSTDNTVNVCKERLYNVIELKNHYGLDYALEVGYQFGVDHGYEYIIRFDGSGFYSPQDLQKIISHIKDRYDIIIGSRYKEFKDLPFSLKLDASNIKSKTGKKILDLKTGLIALTRRVAIDFLSEETTHLTPNFLIKEIKNGYNVLETDVSYAKTSKKVYFDNNNVFTTLGNIWIHKLFKNPKKR